jgi:hypothetical protein
MAGIDSFAVDSRLLGGLMLFRFMKQQRKTN